MVIPFIPCSNSPFKSLPIDLPAPPPDNDEVVAETPPARTHSVDDTFLEDEYEPPPAYSSHDHIVSDATSSPSNAAKRHNTLAPRMRRKDTASGSSSHLRVGEAKPMKPLHPVPVVSPSAFLPYILRANPTQDLIEDFSSPVKPIADEDDEYWSDRERECTQEHCFCAVH